MKKAPQSGVEGLPLFQTRPHVPRFAPVTDAWEDLGYRPSSRRVQEVFLTAEDKRDEELSFRSLADSKEELILGLPENQRPVTDEDVVQILGPLKEFLAESTSHSH